MASKQVSLSVNDVTIELDYFVQEFIDRTISGMLSVLEGVREVTTLHLSVEADEVTINLNNTTVPINPFVNKIIRNTIFGMVSSLKGVSGINRIDISIKK